MTEADRASSILTIFNPIVLLLHSFFLLFGFILGYWFKSECKSVASPGECSPKSLSYLTKRELIPDTRTKLWEIAANQFSCNSIKAYEELTNLHRKAHGLTAHEKKGEANNARSATISRKAASARAAEQAFRKCMNTMSPEVLKLWDDNFELGQVHSNAWDDSKEKANDGITFQVLEETANTFDRLE